MPLNDTEEWYYDPKFLYNYSEIATSCVSFVYAIPAFYTLTRLCILYRRGRLSGSFYKLMCVFGVNDIISYLIQVFLLRLPYWGIFSYYERMRTGFLLTLLYFAMNASSYVQVCGCIFMAANRASAMFAPFAYERLWQRYGWFFILAITIPVQYLNIDLFAGGVKYNKLGPSMYLIVVIDDFAETGFENCCVCLIGSLVALVFNIYTGFRLLRHRKQRHDAANLLDIKFFYICVVMFFSQFFWTLKQIVVHYATPLGPWQLGAFMVGPFVTDMNLFFPIYSILILSREVRAQVLPWLTKIYPEEETSWRANSLPLSNTAITPPRNSTPVKISTIC